MARTVRIAAAQMDANPAPTGDRLARAERLVAEADSAGAQLVVLPELFNTGYAYLESNYRRAEPLHGPTAAWMKQTAARRGLHLAGSLLLLDDGEVYNSQLLFAPDGRFWRYDKNYPWGWERAYFRAGRQTRIADTTLGDVGMMICWDCGHAELWRRYAGRVDLMVITSCPPDATDPSFHLPKGRTFTFDDLGPALRGLKGTAQKVFGEMIDEQAAWLGVPVVNTVGCGRIRTPLPNGLGTLLSFLPMAPKLLPLVAQASRLEMTADMVEGCKIVDARGEVVSHLTSAQGEAVTVSEVTLADEKPALRPAQPRSPVPRLGRFASDTLLPLLTAPVYRRGRRLAWGRQKAPRQPTRHS